LHSAAAGVRSSGTFLGCRAVIAVVTAPLALLMVFKQLSQISWLTRPSFRDLAQTLTGMAGGGPVVAVGVRPSGRPGFVDRVGTDAASPAVPLDARALRQRWHGGGVGIGPADGADQRAVRGPSGRPRVAAPAGPARVAPRPGQAAVLARGGGRLVALAAAQPTEARRHRLAGLLCLGSGAGLERAELRAVTGRHVIERSGGLLVAVYGGRDRTVPVPARYQPALGRQQPSPAAVSSVAGSRPPART
jgi:hypothetical protein